MLSGLWHYNKYTQLIAECPCIASAISILYRMWFHNTLFHIGICALLLHFCSSDCHQLSLVLHYWLEVIYQFQQEILVAMTFPKSTDRTGLDQRLQHKLDIPAVAGMSGSVLKHLIHTFLCSGSTFVDTELHITYWRDLT